MVSFRTFLEQHGVVSRDALAGCGEAASGDTDEFEVALLETATLDDEELVRWLGEFHKLPGASHAQIASVPQDVLALVPDALAIRLHVCPIAATDETLDVAASRPLQPNELAEIEAEVRRRVSQAVASPVALAQSLHLHYRAEIPARYERAVKMLPLSPVERAARPVASETPLDPSESPSHSSQALTMAASGLLTSVLGDATTARGQPAPPAAKSKSRRPPVDRTGQVFGEKYKLVRLLGTGGMGAVYEASHLVINRRCAVKVLHPAVAHDPDIVRRFIVEAKAASAIGHRGIVDIYDVGTTGDGAPYLVMEFLGGSSLSFYLGDGRKLATSWSLDVAIQTLQALGVAHARGIIHRDLKPDNLNISQEYGLPPVVKVLDFGISKMAQARAATDQTTRTGTVLGTPQYMAPEQAAGERDVDYRLDLYAVGAILYECLCGRPPFQGDNVNQLLVKILMEDFPKPTDLNPSLPLGLDAAILKAMARSPRDRFTTAEEMVKALARFLPASHRARMGISMPDTVGVGVEVPSLMPRPRVGPATPVVMATKTTQRQVPRRRLLLPAVIGAVAVAGVVAAALFLWGPSRGTEAAAAGTAGRADASDGSTIPSKGQMDPATDRDWVVISLQNVPAEATVLFDGARVRGLPLRVKRSLGGVVVEVRVPGVDSWKELVVPDRDQDVTVSLDASSSSAAATRPDAWRSTISGHELPANDGPRLSPMAEGTPLDAEPRSDADALVSATVAVHDGSPGHDPRAGWPREPSTRDGGLRSALVDAMPEQPGDETAIVADAEVEALPPDGGGVPVISMPRTPSRVDVALAFESLRGGVRACAAGLPGSVTCRATIDGPTGGVTAVDITTGYSSPAVVVCVRRLVLGLHLPSFSDSRAGVEYTFRFASEGRAPGANPETNEDPRLDEQYPQYWRHEWIFLTIRCGLQPSDSSLLASRRWLGLRRLMTIPGTRLWRRSTSMSVSFSPMQGTTPGPWSSFRHRSRPVGTPRFATTLAYAIFSSIASRMPARNCGCIW